MHRGDFRVRITRQMDGTKQNKIKLDSFGKINANSEDYAFQSKLYINTFAK